MICFFWYDTAESSDVLKQPLQTSITVDDLDFDDFHVEENLHIAIPVKDFKAIVAHAETIKANVTAAYSLPRRPMQLSYEEHGMRCTFTIMTKGDHQGRAVTPAPVVQRPVPRQVSVPSDTREEIPAHVRSVEGSMAPPNLSQAASRSFTREPQSQRARRPSPPAPRPSLDPESLFLPADDDEDRMWGERNEGEDEVGWSASAVRVSLLKSSLKPCRSDTHF